MTGGLLEGEVKPSGLKRLDQSVSEPSTYTVGNLTDGRGKPAPVFIDTVLQCKNTSSIIAALISAEKNQLHQLQLGQ
jgi:hypothetical protein